MAKPLIGITGPRIYSAEIVTTPYILAHTWTEAYMAHYGRAIAHAGGIPVYVTRDCVPDEIVARLDGLLIAGGQDVDPRLYDQVPLATATRLDPERDRFESALIRAALEEDKPLIGICRGMQLMNVALGGTLVRDLVGRQEDEHTLILYSPQTRVHTVHLADGSRMAEVYGEEVSVNSFHHQAIDDPGQGVAIVGIAPDGVVEAIEVTHGRALGVQWHPEMLDELDPLFTWLVNECGAGRARHEGATVERCA